MTTEPTKKWTPSPWVVCTSGRGSVCVVSDDTWICGEIDNQPHEIPTSETDANADLIAAAPLLYEALENLVIGVGMGWETDVAIINAKAVLALARGETP